MNEGWHVTAQDITQWTNTNRRQAQDILPLLIRKLVLASIKPSLLSFPAKDSILLGGWDGILNAKVGNAFVPIGDSVWEFSTNIKINEKAKLDYQKRTNDPKGFDKNKTTFVFATTRTWAKRDDYVNEKNSEGKWAQVKGLNSDDFETWLEQCPAVHRWFSRLIGKRPEGAWDIDQAWSDWSYSTQPACSADLVLAGRQAQATDLTNKFNAEPSVIQVIGESEEEAYAFILAVLKNYAHDFSSRFLVVKEQKEWDILIDSQQPLILIPKFDNYHSLGLATKRGHWVLLPVSHMQYIDIQTGINLSKSDRDQQIKALIVMGLEEDIAKEVVRTCRGYLSPIRRHTALAPVDYQKPNWATPEHAGLLIAVLLSGAWISDNENDCDKLSQLADIPYNEFEQWLHKWEIADDPPIRHVENVWQIVSRQDAWFLLSRFINASILQRFGEVAKRVLKEIDPRFELVPEERWLANVHGKVTKYSILLRHGLAEMLAILACYGDRDCYYTGTLSIQDQVSIWVKQILMEDMSGQRWGSLSSELPFLAEAAPEIFMEAVETSLQAKNPQVMELFVEEGTMGGCPHAGLLWALEGISWNLEYFARVVRIIAKLARMDPGGHYTNRPSNTLREIFQGWLPQTKASLDERLKIIDSLIRFEPESGWNLLLDLLPGRVASISTPLHRPYFRNWDEGWKKGVTGKEYYQHTVAITERIFNHVNEEPNIRWPDLIKIIPQLTNESINEAIILLKKFQLTDFTDTTTNEIRKELRKIISHHREFSDAKWALPKETIDQLNEVYQSLIPDDPITKYKFLFDNQLPKLTDYTPLQDYEQKIQLIEHARIDALNEIWRDSQASGIKCLATIAIMPWIVGNSIGNCNFRDEIEDVVLSWLGNDNSSLDLTAKGYVNARYFQDHEWLTSINEKYFGTWSNKIWAAFCIGLPFKKAVFNFLETLEEDVKKLYWENVRRYYLQDEDGKNANFVIQQLLTYKRPLAAIAAAAQYLHTIARDTGLDGDLLARALEFAASEPEYLKKPHIIPDRYDIVKIIKQLQSDPKIDKKRLARIEWLYIRIFHHNDIQPTVLQKEVMENPNFFVHLICLNYKGNPPIEGEFSDLSPEVLKYQAENAWYLLDSMDKLPGQSSTHEVDASVLQDWIEKVRVGCAQRNRKAIGDECIGKILSNSPYGGDGIWPHETVRDVIEIFESRDIERGIEVGLYNKQSGVFRAIDEGRKQEHELAEKYSKQADEIKYSWPRTAAMLRRMADSSKRLITRWALKYELEDELF